MDTLLIKCPNCGAPVRRKKGAHFAKCEYCDTEIGFDEIKEEAQVDVLRDKVSTLEEKDNVVTTQRRSMKSWLQKRNIFLSVIGILSFLAFFLVGISTGARVADDPLVGAGAICMLLGTMGSVAGSFVLSSAYPDYNIITDKKESKLKKWFQLVMVCLGVSVMAALIAFLVITLIIQR